MMCAPPTPCHAPIATLPASTLKTNSGAPPTKPSTSTKLKGTDRLRGNSQASPSKAGAGKARNRAYKLPLATGARTPRSAFGAKLMWLMTTASPCELEVGNHKDCTDA